MSEPLHIMIGGEHGTLLTFTLPRKRFLITTILLMLTITALVAGSFFTAGFSLHNRLLVRKMEVMRTDLAETQKTNNNYNKKLSDIITENKNKIATLKLKNEILVANLQRKNTRHVADLELKNIKQQTSFKKEREQLLSTVVNELNERNQLIKTVMHNIGIKTKSKEAKNSGGPYIAMKDGEYDELLYTADKYLETLRTLPLGKPVPGAITSRYGSRVDPLNTKKAFHSGIDFRGKHGVKVRATAHGKIIYAGKNGSFGNFIKIDHGNGFTTSFAHLQSYHVKKGDLVTRGQVIGLVGSSGRSTGPHLHYEIARNGKSVNPYKYMKF